MSQSLVACGLVVLAVLALSVARADAAEAPPTGVGQAAPLHIGAATADRQEAPLYEPVEFTVDLQATYDNPFDPDQVALDAEFRTPSGGVERLPGFYYQGFDAAYADGKETLTPHGPPAWKVRYTPRVVGDYSVTFRARDRRTLPEAARDTGSAAASAAEGSGRLLPIARPRPAPYPPVASLSRVLHVVIGKNLHYLSLFVRGSKASLVVTDPPGNSCCRSAMSAEPSCLVLLRGPP